MQRQYKRQLHDICLSRQGKTLLVNKENTLLQINKILRNSPEVRDKDHQRITENSGHTNVKNNVKMSFSP